MKLENMTLAELRDFKDLINKKELEKLAEFRGQKVLGFKLSEVNSKDSKSGKRYNSWKAYLCHEGKRHVVHVGNDPLVAEEKIKKYLLKHPELNGVAG